MDYWVEFEITCYNYSFAVKNLIWENLIHSLSLVAFHDLNGVENSIDIEDLLSAYSSFKKINYEKKSVT